MSEASVKRSQRKEQIGEVVSNRMNKTIVVRIQRRISHPRYRKVISRYKKLYAHDEKGEAQVGDRVKILETRPLSKLKCWRLVEVVSRNPKAEAKGAS